METARSNWIKSPWMDLTFFSFGWVPVLATFWLIHQYDLKGGESMVLYSILLFNFLHRHLTYPLVYGDPEQFNARKKAYIGLPILLLAIAVASLTYSTTPEIKTPKITEPIQIGSESSVEFLVQRDAAKQMIRGRLSGAETSLAEVAESLSRGLSGALNVEVVGDSLRIYPRNPDSVSRFVLIRVTGDSGFVNRLGLGKFIGKTVAAKRPLFTLLVMLGVFWNMFHSVMQKMGVLRIYSRKAGTENGSIDKGFIFSWFGFVLVHLISLPSIRSQALAISSSGLLISSVFERLAGVFPALVLGALIVALVCTYRYLKQEWQRESFEWPKNLFVLSILLLYSIFYYDVFVGYAVFGFSHAIEYLVFVNIFAQKKFRTRPLESSFMARAVRHQAFSMGLYSLIMIVTFVAWNHWSASTIYRYIVGSAFLHFIYDGWIWKVKNPSVGQPFGITYSASA